MQILGVTCRYAVWQADRKAGNRANIWAGRQAGCHTVGQTCMHFGKQAGSQAVGQTGKHLVKADMQAGRAQAGTLSGRNAQN
jgi:hypothetical protein